MIFGRWQESIVFLAACSALVAFTILPLLALAAEVTATVPEDSLALLLSGELWSLLLWSVLRAGVVTLLAILLGVPLGFLLGRTDVAGRRAAFLLHAFPMFLPPFLLALGWFYLLGRQGIVGSESSAAFLFSAPGLILILAATFAPIVTALTALALDGIDPSLEEAGRVVASRWRVARNILLPIAWPSTTLAALVVFALALSDLGVPMFLRVQSYQAAVFARIGGISYGPGEALVLALPLFAVALVLLALERLFIGRRPFTVLGLRRVHKPIPLGRWRPVGTVLVWLISLLGVLPIAALIHQAVAGDGFDSLGGWLGSSVQNTLVTGFAAATIITLLGIVLGRTLGRRLRGSWLPDGIALLAFFTPSAVLGVGLITLWNRPSTALVYTSSAIIVLGYMGRYVVMGIRPMAVVIAQSSPHYEEAAAVAGASFLTRLITITTVMHWRAVMATWLLALVFCLRDIETAVLFYPPGRETLPVRIFTLEANGPQPVVAALSVLHVALTGAVLALGCAVLHRPAR